MIDNNEIRCSHSHGARRKDIEIGKLQSSDAVLESPTVTSPHCAGPRAARAVPNFPQCPTIPWFLAAENPDRFPTRKKLVSAFWGLELPVLSAPAYRNRGHPSPDDHNDDDDTHPFNHHNTKPDMSFRGGSRGRGGGGGFGGGRGGGMFQFLLCSRSRSERKSAC